jgi:hypothetical protein
VAAALLAAVALASAVEGEAADFVGGDDGDALAARRDDVTLEAAASPRPADVCGAPLRAPFVAALDPQAAARRPIASRAVTASCSERESLVFLPPVPSRAPPPA